MPLSDEEERILQEIEAGLYQSDPELARHVRSAEPQSISGGRMRMLVLALFGALILTVLLLKVHFLLAFGGFLLCFGIGLEIERNLREIGRARLSEIATQIRLRGDDPGSDESETDHFH